MDTNEHESKLIHGELVYAIVGCAIEVLNALGHGLNEKPYENALTVEFGLHRESLTTSKPASMSLTKVDRLASIFPT